MSWIEILVFAMPEIVIAAEAHISFSSAKWQFRRRDRWPVSCLPSVGALQALSVVGDDLAKDFVEADSDVPVGIVRL